LYVNILVSPGLLALLVTILYCVMALIIVMSSTPVTVTVCAACQQPVRDGELTVTGGTHPVEATI